MVEQQLLEAILLNLEKFLLALHFAFLLLKVGLACLGVYGLYRLFKYLAGFKRVH